MAIHAVLVTLRHFAFWLKTATFPGPFLGNHWGYDLALGTVG